MPADSASPLTLALRTADAVRPYWRADVIGARTPQGRKILAPPPPVDDGYFPSIGERKFPSVKSIISIPSSTEEMNFQSVYTVDA